MALPPKGDPRRPLHMAVNSMRLLGMLFFLPMLCMIPAVAIGPNAGQGGKLAIGFVVGLCLIPAVFNLVLSIFVRKYQFWAVVCAIVLTSIEALFGLAVALSSTVRSLAHKNAPRTSIFLWLIVVGFVQLIVQLSQSFAAVRHGDHEPLRGFEVLGVQPPTQAPIYPPLPPNTPR